MPQVKNDGGSMGAGKAEARKAVAARKDCEMVKNGVSVYTMSGKTLYNYLHFHLKGELKKLALSDLRQEAEREQNG